MNIYKLHNDFGQSARELVVSAAKSFRGRTRGSHELWILTCYIDFDLIEECISELIRDIRLTKVYLAFNYSEIYKYGPRKTEKKLRSIQDKLRRTCQFKWRAIASSNLMHGKSYALVQEADDRPNGMLLVTSANFTRPGFEGENIEICYRSTRMRDIREFQETYRALWDEFGRGIDSSIFREEQYLLEYALLSSGKFIHKWSFNVRQHIGIKYVLTKRAKELGTVPPALEAIGFEAAADTFTRQVIEWDDLPRKEVPRSFINRFTIETFWGRWCPTDAWNTLCGSFGNADESIRKFQAATKPRLIEKKKSEACKVQRDLVKQGLIEAVGKDHLERWATRVSELRADHRQLRRYFVGYDAHDLPYQIEQKREIRELYRNIEEAVEASKKKNIAKKKIKLVRKQCNAELIHLSAEEKDIIRRMS